MGKSRTSSNQLLRDACKRFGLDLRSAHEEQLMNPSRCQTALPENRDMLALPFGGQTA